MSNSIYARDPAPRFARPQPVESNIIEQRRHDALAAELRGALAREDVMRREKEDLSQRHIMLAQEWEHRTTNGLQLIASQLSLQSLTMATPEARIQLSIAARRVVALGAVHHRLHLSDQPTNVELKEFLISLCDDLSDLLFQSPTDHSIVVEGTKVEIPSSLASALGLITNELITNSVKHANGDIIVRIEKSAPGTYSLSVLDDGPGPPVRCQSTKSKGFGLELVLWLVEQIGGKLEIVPRLNGQRTCISVMFCPNQNPTALS